jgi:hypothetical protein
MIIVKHTLPCAGICNLSMEKAQHFAFVPCPMLTKCVMNVNVGYNNCSETCHLAAALVIACGDCL